MSVDSKTIEQQERTIRREFAADLAGWMLENWIDAPKDYHAAWWPLKKMWFCKKEPLTKDDLVRMFTSESSSTPLGAYFIDPGGNTKRVTLDIDAHKDGESAEPVVRKACAFLKAHGIPFTVARSKGGKGYHVTVYFDHPISSIAARNLGLAIVKVAELPEKTEVFPKQFELRKGEYGSQVALPGSYFFWKKSGGTGSTLVDPETLEAIPFGEWLDYLRSVPPLSEKTLREMAQRGSVDLWAKPKRTTPRFNPDDFVCDGVPTFTAVEQVVGFLSQHGIEVQKEKGAFGDWTDRLLLLSCVNSEAHGSTRSDGAAVLFNAANGRVGYKCWHEGCNLFSWPKLLRKLGYRFRKKTPAEKPAEPPHDHEECEPHDHEECEPEDAPKDHQLSEEERVNMRMGGRNADVSRSGFAVRITEECAMCGETFSKFVCKEHGIFMTRPDRCNKPICPNCVRVKWKVDHEPYIREKWPEKAFFVELPVNTPEEMRSALKRTSHLYRKNRDQQGRWFKGWMSVLYVFDIEDAPYCKSFGLEGKVMAKDEYIPIVRHYWLAQSDGVVEEYRETGDFVSVVERHEDVLKSMKRTSAGKKATKTFPWLSTDAAREQARAAWQAAHPGLKPNECCKVVGKKPDGSPVYCAKKGLQIVEHTRTHEVIAKSTKALRADDIAQAKRAADNRYLEQFRARMFTADAA